MPLGLQAGKQISHPFDRPAFEEPARSRMDMDEIPPAQAETGEMTGNTRFGGFSRDQLQPTLIRPRLEAKPAQGVEIGFRHMPQGMRGLSLNVGETALPVPVTPAHGRPNRPTRLEQAAKPGPPPMLGQMNDQIVTTCLEHAVKRQFRPQLAKRPKSLPVSPNGVHRIDRRMQGQHFCRIGINQCIDFDLGGMGLEGGKNRRRNQHVTMVAQFDDQRAFDLGQRHGIAQGVEFIHGRHFTGGCRRPYASRRQNSVRTIARAANPAAQPAGAGSRRHA